MDGYFTYDDKINHRIHGDEVIQIANKKARLQAKKNGTEIKRVWNEYLNVSRLIVGYSCNKQKLRFYRKTLTTL